MLINIRSHSVEELEQKNTILLCILPNSLFATYNRKQIQILDEEGGEVMKIDKNIAPDITCMIWIEEREEIWCSDKTGCINVYSTREHNELKESTEYTQSEEYNRFKVCEGHRVQAMVMGEGLVYTIAGMPAVLKGWAFDSSLLFEMDLGRHIFTHLSYFDHNLLLLADREGNITLWDTDIGQIFTIPADTNFRSSIIYFKTFIRISQNIFIINGLNELYFVDLTRGSVILENNMENKILAICKLIIK